MEAIRAAIQSSETDHGEVTDREAERRSRIKLIASADFDQASYQIEWLVRRILVKGQFTIVGGPRKALKTSILADLVLSLGAGANQVTPTKASAPTSNRRGFLGHFPITAPARVAFFSGETGFATLKETAKRICAAKGIALAQSGVFWGSQLPRLSDPADLDLLAKTITDNRLQVIVVDPAYLALMGGGASVQMSNLFEVGPVLSDFSQACLEAGATPILVAHSRKYREAGERYEPLELEDLAFAGIQEFARQWILISRRAKYVPGSGEHKLWLNVGGSAGFSSVWAVNVDEGVVSEDFRGRTWDVSVMTAEDARLAAIAERDKKKAIEKQHEKARTRTAIITHLQKPEHKAGDSATGIAVGIGKSKARDIEDVLDVMLDEGVLVKVPIQKGKRKCDAYRLADDFDDED
jgi:hypothetical protein